METLATHYSRLLGTDDSWRVESVDLRLEDRRVEIRLKHVGSGVSCPECGRACGLADHAEERRWRHLNTMQFTTVHIRRPSMVLGVEHIPLHVFSLLLVVSLVLVKPEAVEVRILHGEANLTDLPASAERSVTPCHCTLARTASAWSATESARVYPGMAVPVSASSSSALSVPAWAAAFT